MRVLKLIAFGLTAILTVAMVAATFVEKTLGTAVTHEMIYTSPITIMAWGTAATAGTVYLLRRLDSAHCATTGFHLSLVVILAGAMTTHMFGQSGTMTLEKGETAVNVFQGESNDTVAFPFSVCLTDCFTEYYPGTKAAKDHVSIISITTRDGQTVGGRISMNNVFEFEGYRMYQMAIGEKSSTIGVTHDPWGVCITYSGYLMLLLSMIMFLFQRKSMFRRLPAANAPRRGAAICAVALLAGMTATAGNGGQKPRVLQRGLAKSFGKLYVCHNERICPLSTMATDFCVRLCGGKTYNGFTAEQVLTGWIFYYEDWKDEPMIKVEGNDIKSLLGIDGDYARLGDFYGTDGYRLANSLNGPDNKNALDADDKCNLISLVCTGKAMRIYPYKRAGTGKVTVEWLSWVDRMPEDMNENDMKFITGNMEYIARQIEHGRNIEANEALMKIKEYQKEKAGNNGILPDDSRFEAELAYNRFADTRTAAIACIAAGILSLITLIKKKSPRHGIAAATDMPQTVAMTAIMLYLSAMAGLKWFINGHIPLANGFDTMIFMAWSSMAAAMFLRRRIAAMVPAGFLISGFALLVASIGNSSNRITHLNPVLDSPLMCIHVMVIMIAYTLLAVTAANSLTAILPLNTGNRKRLMTINRILLYPAVFLLALGIFTGAVWANMSWGAYWSWDPKETWALVTMLVYSLPIHTCSLPFFRRPAVFHVYILAAFASVLMTYFGVNFVLGGMHSYV